MIITQGPAPSGTRLAAYGFAVYYSAVIYFNRLSEEAIWLLLIYAKSAQENIPAHTLRAIKAEIEGG